MANAPDERVSVARVVRANGPERSLALSGIGRRSRNRNMCNFADWLGFMFSSGSLHDPRLSSAEAEAEVVVGSILVVFIIAHKAGDITRTAILLQGGGQSLSMYNPASILAKFLPYVLTESPAHGGVRRCWREDCDQVMAISKMWTS